MAVDKRTVAVLWSSLLAGAGLAQATGTTLTGFGATDAAWNHAHSEDHKYPSGTAYDPDPTLPKVNGRVADHYYAVQHVNGYVLFYSYRFRARPFLQAKALVLRTEFPADAQVVWFANRRGLCAQMLVRSATVARAIGRRPVGDKKGTALVELTSGAGDSYTARSVNNAGITQSHLVSKGSAPGC